MMRNSFLLISGSIFALSACSDNRGVTTPPASGSSVEMQASVAGATAPIAETVSAPMANSADEYVMNAAMGDLYEIESSNLALEKSESDNVRQFAQQMITDHTDTTARLNSTVASAGLQITPPAYLDTRRSGMINSLRNLSGEEFDRAYIEQQMIAHQEALLLHSGFAASGDNDELRTLASEIAPKIQSHLEMLNSMNTGAE